MEIDAAEEYEEDGYGMDAVSPNTQCYACGGFGHMARNCGKAKGKGKAAGKSWGDKAKVKGKGEGKLGFGKAAPYGINKGKGKGSGAEVKTYGYQGTCWKCNRVGHKAWECQAIGVARVDGDETEEEEVECG